MGHCAPLRKKEWSNNSLRSLKTYTGMCCAMMAPLHVSSQLCFSLFSLYGHTPAKLCTRHFAQVTQSLLPVPKRGGRLHRLPCLTWAGLEAESHPEQHQWHPPDFSCKNIKSTRGSRTNWVEPDLFQSINAGTRATLVTIQMHIHTTDPKWHRISQKTPKNPSTENLPG